MLQSFRIKINYHVFLSDLFPFDFKSVMYLNNESHSIDLLLYMIPTVCILY